MEYKFEDIGLVRKDNGKKLYFNKCTSSNSVSEKNLLLIHGLTFSNHVFDINYKDYSVVRFFAGNAYTVWRVDIGGYGKSEKYVDGFEVDTANAAKDIITALEKICEFQQVDCADVLAWSWGTMTSAKACEMRPELFRRLVWMGPCFGGTFPVRTVTEAFTTLSFPYYMRVFQGESESDFDVDYEVTEPAVVGLWCDQVFRYDCGHGRPNGGNREVSEGGEKWLIHVPGIQRPTACIYGTKDKYTDPKRAGIALQQLPEGSECHVLDGAGHAAWIEKEYYKVVREKILFFLNKSI